ncbi:hypothetical protein SDC9_178781 [bioreactor metagenome]|uniref:Uncharacterized protein n=1 Tax=bioreactor metagenome TaxID=1076179 RepID=A0A645GX67_9ZZZZ
MLEHVERDGFLELLDKMRQFRSRAYKAHFSAEHVEELRQFVDAGLADKAAEAGLARVVVGRPGGVFLAVDAHGAKLIHLEQLFIFADAVLTEDDRPRAGEFDADDRKQHDRTCEHD